LAKVEGPAKAEESIEPQLDCGLRFDLMIGISPFPVGKVTFSTSCKSLITSNLRKLLKNIQKIAKKLVVKPGGFAYCPLQCTVLVRAGKLSFTPI